MDSNITWDRIVQLLADADKCLSSHAFLAILIIAVPLGIIVVLVNIGRDVHRTAGRIANVIMSIAGAVTAVAALLPFALRATLEKQTPPILPECIGPTESPCFAAVQDYLSKISHDFVPYSDFLGASVLFSCFAALLWLSVATRNAFKS
jgi:hypothetical protein